MRIALISALMMLTLAACGGSGGSPAPGTEAPAAGVEVAIANFAYDPQSTTASVGQSVTWTNNDSAPHTVTFDDGPDLGQFGDGETVTHTFDTAGEFAYHCNIHPSMRGTVAVQ